MTTKKTKKKHTYQVKIGNDGLYKPLAAEYLGCIAILIPILIFVIIFILFVLQNYEFF